VEWRQYRSKQRYFKILRCNLEKGFFEVCSSAPNGRLARFYFVFRKKNDFVARVDSQNPGHSTVKKNWLERMKGVEKQSLAVLWEDCDNEKDAAN
jgi:hypothetical protein